MLAKADEATGHDKATELYGLAKHGKLKENDWSKSPVSALAKAAMRALEFDGSVWVVPEGGVWAITMLEPHTYPHFYKVTPQLKATDEAGASADAMLWNAVHLFIESGSGHEAAPEPAKPETPPVEGSKFPEWAKPEQWVKGPGWKELHAQIKDLKSTDLKGRLSGSAGSKLPYMLHVTNDLQAAVYLVKNSGQWKSTFKTPLDGSYAAPLALYFYEVTPDHRIILHDITGDLYPYTVDEVQSILNKGLVPEPEPAAEVPKAAEELPKQETEVTELQGGVPAILDGVYAGEFPSGSVVYHKHHKAGYGTVTVFARDPSGTWWVVNVHLGIGGMPSVGKAASYVIDDSNLSDGSLVELNPSSAQEVGQAKKVAEALKLIFEGTVKVWKTQPGGKKIFPTWASAAVYALSTQHPGSDAIVFAVDGGFSFGSLPSGTGYWRVGSVSLQVRYISASENSAEPSPALQDEFLAAVNQHVIAGSVTVDDKVYGFGYWKNPKGKTYLKIQPATGYIEYHKYGPAASGKYTYYNTDGAGTEITPAAAAKHLAKATEFSAVPFPVVESKVTKVNHATVLAPGTFKTWSIGDGGVGKSVINVKEDGSSVLQDENGAHSNPLLPETLQLFMQGGGVLDQYGTTAVKPGLQPDGYHIWGSTVKTAGQVQAMLDWLHTAPDEQWAPKTQEFLGGWEKVKGNGQKFMVDHNVVGGDGQRAAFTQLLHELLAVPKLPEGADLSDTAPSGKVKYEEPVFLKDMPPGITQAKDVFTWTQQGSVMPYKGTIPLQPENLTKPELKEKIASISASFGDGKVVGTHLSSLSVKDLGSWLKACKKGDMVTVFSLDAAAGKVSPAHPGALDNTETHHVTWSPLDPGQVPASQDIAGSWSVLSEVLTLPKAEVDNYLIKMGFKNAEYLYWLSREAVVRSHRLHNQDEVDTYTLTANLNQAHGVSPFTEVPAWTDGLKPAKPYDQYLKDSTPAGTWTVSAVKAFVVDHKAEVMLYLDTIAENAGYTEGNGQYLIDQGYLSYQVQAIQDWLDNEHAKHVAEQSVPVWKKVDTGALPSHGHEVWKAVRTIPYTGESTTWFVKPAPGGKVFRLEQEHAANLLGKLFGFQSAESQLLPEKDFGQVVQAQKAIPGEALGHYTDMPPWSSFTDKQVADIATEHLLDWVLANDDTSANNMIKTPAGRIVGIDKGRSFGDMAWDGLAGNAAMDSMTQLVYTKLYNGIRSHQIAKDTADQAYLQVIQRARKMAAVPENRVRKILEQGFAHRTKWGQSGDMQGLVNEVMDRKGNLEQDFTKLWRQVYKDAGIGELPEVPSQKLPEIHGAQLHSGFSEPDFAGHVSAAKSHGVAAFFGGRELRDMHVLVWQQKDSFGHDVTHGETFLRGASYDKVVSWLKSHSDMTSAGNQTDDTTVYPGDSYGPGKAPSGSPDRGGVEGEAGYYNAIIRAARSVTKHKSDGDYTSGSSLSIMDALESARKQMEADRASAEEQAFRGTWTAASKNVIAMANQYLGYVDQVLAAKNGAYGFGSGDLPRWLPLEEPKKEEPVDELASLGIKLHYGVSSSHDKGSIDEASGEFKSDEHTSPHHDPGKLWQMTLPGGEKIEFGNGNEHGVQNSHHGRVRFSAPDGSAASLESIRQALQLTGLEMREAEPADFESAYWRHLLSIMNDRKDSEQQPVWHELVNQFTELGLQWPGSGAGPYDHRAVISELEQLGKTDPAAETAIYRAAFAKLTSPEQVQQFADRGGFFPVQKHFDVHSPGVAGGKPDWYRFDLLSKVTEFPHVIRQSSHPDTVAEGTVKGGGSYSKDALMRVTGQLIEGMGNPYESGATGYAFTRLDSPDVTSSNKVMMFSPLVLLRSRNYSYSDDFYGNTISSSEGGYNQYSRREYAYWKFRKYQEGSNETLVSDALSLLDDVELLRAGSYEQRDELIKWLKDRGVTAIRHMPVEDRIVKHITDESIAKVEANWKAHPELLDPFAAAGGEYEAQAAALDTPAAAQAAEHGDDPHLKFIVDYLVSMDKAGGAVIYKAGGGMYYVKYPSGNWYSFTGADGSTSGPYAELSPSFVKVLNEGAADGSLSKVWGV